MKIFGFRITMKDNLARAVEAEAAAQFWAEAHVKLAETYDLTVTESSSLTSALSAALWRANKAELALIYVRKQLMELNGTPEKEGVTEITLLMENAA